MKELIVDEIFSKIQEVTGIKDVAYHEIKEGRLCPFMKTETHKLSNEKWVETHSQNPVYIDEHILLRELTTEGETVIITDVDSNPKSSSAFFLFGIKSIMVIPVKEGKQVTGIICVASIGQKYQFTEWEMETCTSFANDITEQTKEEIYRIA